MNETTLVLKIDATQAETSLERFRENARKTAEALKPIEDGLEIRDHITEASPANDRIVSDFSKNIRSETRNEEEVDSRLTADHSPFFPFVPGGATLRGAGFMLPHNIPETSRDGYVTPPVPVETPLRPASLPTLKEPIPSPGAPGVPSREPESVVEIHRKQLESDKIPERAFSGTNRDALERIASTTAEEARRIRQVLESISSRNSTSLEIVTE